MDTKMLLTIIGAAVALISSLILIILNGMGKRIEGQERAIERIHDGLTALRSGLRDKVDKDSKLISSQIDEAEKGLHALQTSILSKNVTKEECQRATNELKERIIRLEQAIREVNSVTREQSVILARIEQAVKSL